MIYINQHIHAIFFKLNIFKVIFCLHFSNWDQIQIIKLITFSSLYDNYFFLILKTSKDTKKERNKRNATDNILVSKKTVKIKVINIKNAILNRQQTNILII